MVKGGVSFSIGPAGQPEGSGPIVVPSVRASRFNRTTGVSNVQRVVMDTTVTPRALYVSMGAQGLAVIRAK